MPVSPELTARWRSKAHVGGAAPTLRVTLTRGLIDKTYMPFEKLDGRKDRFMTIAGGNNDEPWQGFWRATGEPIELPNVFSVTWDTALKEKGARSAVITVENIIYKAVAGAGGLYHQIARGFLSPTRGARLLYRLMQVSQAQNEWYEVLNNGYRIDVFEGYGDQQTRTFTGLIDSTELEALPDRITISARSFWMLITDQRMMGANKPPEIRSPVTFADHSITTVTPKVAFKDWCLVHDWSGLIKAVFMWAGYKEWEVESVGLSLKSPFSVSFTMDKFFQDVIDEVIKHLNYVCYEKKPSSFAESLGVPVFEHNKAFDPPTVAGMLEITDNDMLETIHPKFDLSNLPYVFRVRGNIDSSSGSTYDEDTVKRFMGTYFPPWSGAGPADADDPRGSGVDRDEAGRTSGVRRHAYILNEALLSEQECIFEAIIASMDYALESVTAQVQISGYPGVELNDQVSIVSNSTGINSRLWVASIHSEHTTGPKGSWKMTLGGSLIDTDDMQELGEDLRKWRLFL